MNICSCGHEDGLHHSAVGRCYGCRNEVKSSSDNKRTLLIHYALDKLVEKDLTPGEPGLCSSFKKV